MTDHPIRLRGGWERLPPVAGAQPCRITLPLDRWPGDWPRLRLLRRFRTPEYDTAVESLWLRLEALNGLVAAALNDCPLPVTASPDGTALIPIGGLCRPGNVLTLDVDPDARTAAGDGLPWGAVALVIRQVPES